jgi:hypothetical protein
MNTHNTFDLASIEFRVIRIFLLAFIILLAFQAVQFINTRRIDRQHSELMVTKTRSLEALQNLLIQTSTIQRKLLNLALADSETERQELMVIIEEAEKSNNESLQTLTTGIIGHGPALADESAALLKARDGYARSAAEFRSLILSGQREAALEFRNVRLRTDYEAYQGAQQQLLVATTNDLIGQTDRISRYTATSGWVLFFLGLAPFIYAITKLVYLMILIRFKSEKISMQQEVHYERKE